jgi:deazaflavin-dependent oxidoreductase (nitroreductase family)
MSALHRVIRWLGHRRWFAAAGRRYGARIDRVLYRLTRGRVTTTAGAAPVLLLTTTGRKSGSPRTTPVMYLRDGDRFIVTSENFGQQRPAAWPLNLAADPRATVQVGSDVVRCRARLLADDEADRYWPRLVEAWPAHETYLARSGSRHTFVLEPVADRHDQRAGGAPAAFTLGP